MLLVSLTSCAAHRVVSIGDRSLDTTSGLAHRARVAGYTTSDGRYHRFDGYLRLAGDSVVLVQPSIRSRTLEADSRERTVVLARDQVLSVKVAEGVDIPKSVLLGTILATFFAFVLSGVTGGNRLYLW
jgi:hypothetical protein